MPQLPGERIGPANPNVPEWLRPAVQWMQDQYDTWQQQPAVKLASSPLGQAMAVAIPGLRGEGPDVPNTRMNLLEGAPHKGQTIGSFKGAFDGALDRYYDLPPASSKALRQPRVNAVNNIYDQLAATGVARPASEVSQSAQDAFAGGQAKLNQIGAVPREIASPTFRAQQILQHLADQKLYVPKEGDLEALAGHIQTLQDSGLKPTNAAWQGDRRLGEVVRQTRLMLPKNSPLRSAMGQASGWSQFEQPDLSRLALLSQMGK